jgi:hypothetical protein
MKLVRLWTSGGIVAGLLLVSAALLATAQQAGRQVGTIGPPPRKNPERQTSAEGMPPLPLPAVPLRRSEPKAEPAPPLFIAKLMYGDTQDYMPNPGDVDNLMRHSRAELGLWYGWKVLNLNELVALHKAGKSSPLPALYLTGYQEFRLSDDQRAALRQYLLDGGTLIGDATLGSPAFTQSFRNEVRAMFPDRAFDVLQVDHPVFRAFYKYADVHYFDVTEGHARTSQGPPEIIGMNLGTRTAILFSPADLSCGWDEFWAPTPKERVPGAPRGRAMIPGDAIRFGVNLVGYVAALRQVAEVESVTHELQGPKARGRQQLTLAQLRHQGDWNPDPNSSYQWLRELAGDSSLAINFDLKYVDATERQLAAYPFLYLTGFRDPKFSAEERAALQHHLQAGGFLFINNCSGYQEFDRHVRALVAELFHDQQLAPVPAEHPLLRSFFTVTTGKDRQSGADRPIELEGITVKNRLVLVYSKNDMISQLKQVSDPFGNGYDHETCRRLAVNVVAYALQN